MVRAEERGRARAHYFAQAGDVGSREVDLAHTEELRQDESAHDGAERVDQEGRRDRVTVGERIEPGHGAK
jgi:hypothetical protein